MADNRSDPTDDIPEADLLEQRAAADPATDTGDVIDLVEDSSDTVADPADRQEQLTPAGDDDEDYPHG